MCITNTNYSKQCIATLTKNIRLYVINDHAFHLYNEAYLFYLGAVFFYFTCLNNLFKNYFLYATVYVFRL